MTVLVKPWKDGEKFQVYIGFRWPDMSRHVERKVVDAPTETQARKWGERRERELRSSGPASKPGSIRRSTHS